MVSKILLVAAASFVIAWVMTLLIKRIAPRFGFVDKPGHRKIHSNPKPLGGGIAIFLAIALPLLGVLAAPHLGIVPAGMEAFAGGIIQQTPLALALLGSMLGLHIVGLIDDRKALGPYSKLVVQLAAAAVLVIFFKQFRAVTYLGPVPSCILTILWITGITNAFNFLDNMDGLSAGVAAVCAAAFLVTTLLIGQWFVAGLLAMLLGALLGFLCFNFSPASIFMGDSGSLVVGFTLGVLTILTTYLDTGKRSGGWYALLTPLIILAVPLYDLTVVSVIRISRGKSPFVGDTNHFSHRLVARGMSRRTAVLCIYLVTAATAVAAIILPRLDALGAVMVYVQTLLILGVVMLLELHPLPPAENGN